MTSRNRPPRRRTPTGERPAAARRGRARGNGPSHGGGNGKLVLLGVLAALAAIGIVFHGPIRDGLSRFVEGVESDMGYEKEPREREPAEVISRVRRGEREEELRTLPDGPAPSGEPLPALESRPLEGPEDDRAHRLFRNAIARMDAGEFAEANAILDRAAALEIGEKAFQAIQKHRNLAQLFLDVKKRNPPDREARAGNLYTFEVRGMGRFQGAVEHRGLETIKIAKDSGITVTLKKSDVISQERIDPAQRRRALRRELEDLKIRTPRTGVGRWRLSRFALRKGLEKEAIELLREAAELDEKLPESIYEERAKQILKAWIYYTAAEIEHEQEERFRRLKEEFPQSKAYALAQEMLQEEREARRLAYAESSAAAEAEPDEPAAPTRDEETIEQLRRRAEPRAAPDPEPAPARPEPRPAEPAPEPASPPAPAGGGSSLEQQADAALREGMEKFSRGSTAEMPGEGRKLMREALAALERAIDLYGQLIDKHPENPTYRKRQAEAQRKLRWASKLRRVG
jgi:hypothetical protein